MKNHRFCSLFFLLVLLASLLSPAALAAEEMEVDAKAALLIDPTTGEILYEKNIHERLYPASLTKIMSASLVLDAIDAGTLTMEQMLTASEAAINAIPAGSSTAGIKIGESLSVENLLYCMLVASANEACNVLAEAVSGSMDAFVAEMNAKAAELGCEDTHFVNANGLHDDDHYTTAWDLYLITQEALAHEEFLAISDTRYFTLPATEFNNQRTYYTTNLLLSPYRGAGYVYQYAHGIKTGTTTPAGNCLISLAEKSGRQLLGVILGAEKITLEDGSTKTQSFAEMIRLFDWGFDSFTRQTVITSDQPVYELSVALSETDFVVLHPAQNVERLLPNDVAVEDLQWEFSLVADVVDAPIAEGDVMGEVVIRYGDTIYATVPLLASTDVSASRLLVFRRDVSEFVARREVRIGAVAVLVLLLGLIVLVKLSGRRRRRYGRGTRGYSGSNYRGRRRR